MNTLQYRVDGPADAPVLVMGPSLGTTWHMWDRQIPELAGTWRIVRFDLPGHGGAPAHPAVSVSELADRLIATLDELGVQRFGYAGSAIGAAVGADLALRHPQRLASLALIAASARFGTADEFRQRGVVVRSNGMDPMARSAPERWFTPAYAAAQPAIVEWAVQMVRTTDPGCYIAACEALAAFDIRADLARIGVPTLVLAGAEDRVTGPGDARTLVAGIPDARLAVVPGAAHLAPVEQPAAVTDLLVDHFSTAWHETLTAIPGPAAPPVAAVAVPPSPQTLHVPVPMAAEPVPAPASEIPVRPDPYEQGMKLRREVLGDARVDAETMRRRRFHRRLPGARHPLRLGRGVGPRRARPAHPGRRRARRAGRRMATSTRSRPTPAPRCGPGSPPTRSRKCCSRRPCTAASRRRARPSGRPPGSSARRPPRSPERSGRRGPRRSRMEA